MRVYRHRENSNWNRGPFDRQACIAPFPKFGIVAESMEEYFDILRQLGMTQEPNDILMNPGYYQVQSRIYFGSKKKGNKVIY